MSTPSDIFHLDNAFEAIEQLSAPSDLEQTNIILDRMIGIYQSARDSAHFVQNCLTKQKNFLIPVTTEVRQHFPIFSSQFHGPASLNWENMVYILTGIAQPTSEVRGFTREHNSLLYIVPTRTVWSRHQFRIDLFGCVVKGELCLNNAQAWCNIIITPRLSGVDALMHIVTLDIQFHRCLQPGYGIEYQKELPQVLATFFKKVWGSQAPQKRISLPLSERWMRDFCQITGLTSEERVMAVHEWKEQRNNNQTIHTIVPPTAILVFTLSDLNAAHCKWECISQRYYISDRPNPTISRWLSGNFTEESDPAVITWFLKTRAKLSAICEGNNKLWSEITSKTRKLHRLINVF